MDGYITTSLTVTGQHHVPSASVQPSPDDAGLGYEFSTLDWQSKTDRAVFGL